MNFKEGEVLYFDKPLKWTSFAVVNKIRYHICRKLGVKKLKVGHAGTLDPLATGVMIICTGKATKRIEEFQYHTKEYVATLQLGATTPSYDLEKEIDATYPTEHITRELVEETLKRFIGSIEQIPPAFSACMVNGKRAYDLARKGEEVELKPKLLVIDEIELLENDADLRTDAADTAADDAFFLHNMAVDAYAATVSVSGAQAADVADEGGFSGTGRTDEGHHFTGFYAYADVVESPGAGKGLADMVDFNHLIQLLGPRAAHALSVTECIFTGKCYGFVTPLCLFNCEKIAA